MVESHYVPQFYLRNFSITGRPDRVFVYRRDNRDPVDMNVRNIAVVKDFYSVTLEETGEESDMIEEMFSELEGDTADIFTKLTNENPVTLANDQLETLAVFVAFLHVRGRSFRQKDINFRIALVEKRVAEEAKDPERFRADMQRPASLLIMKNNLKRCANSS
jgi:hypothetical protein